MTRLADLYGLRLAGSGLADVAAAGGSVLEGEEVYERLFGARWRDALAERGWDPERAARRYAARRRGWMHRPGATERSLDRATGRSLDRPTEALAMDAARRALADAGWSEGEPALVVAATSTPDRITQSLSARIARALDLRAGALDVRAGGASGLTAWCTAAALLSAGAERALVVAAESSSAYLDPDDLASCLVYGDGAAALALERAPDHPGGLELALLAGAPPEGHPFTVDTPLPPTATHLARTPARFQRPDRPYLAHLERHWTQTCATFRAELAHRPRLPIVFLPASATPAQLDLAHTSFGSPPHPAARDLLDHHGHLGAATALALATLWRRSPLAAERRLTLVTVAGGLHAAALSWLT